MADDVFVLGSDGDIAHFDGRVWEPMGALDFRNSSDVPLTMDIMDNALVTIADGDIEGFLRTRLWNCRACERDILDRIDDDCDSQVDELDVDCDRSDPLTPPEYSFP